MDASGCTNVTSSHMCFQAELKPKHLPHIWHLNHDSVSRLYLSVLGSTSSPCTCTDVHQPAPFSPHFSATRKPHSAPPLTIITITAEPESGSAETRRFPSLSSLYSGSVGAETPLRTRTGEHGGGTTTVDAVDDLRRPKTTLGDIQLDARLWMRLTGTRRRRVRAQAPVNRTLTLRGVTFHVACCAIFSRDSSRNKKRCGLFTVPTRRFATRASGALRTYGLPPELCRTTQNRVFTVHK